jgi:hypothetical protein
MQVLGPDRLFFLAIVSRHATNPALEKCLSFDQATELANSKERGAFRSLSDIVSIISSGKARAWAEMADDGQEEGESKAFLLDKGWISKRSKNGSNLGMLTVESEEDHVSFNLSESGSYREGLLHISQQGTTIHGAGNLLNMSGHEGSPDSKTSAKRANGSEVVRYELKASDFGNLEVLGKGSSGFVRKALNKTRNQLVALKVSCSA